MCAECRAEGAADAARERKQTAAHFLIGAGFEEISSFYDSAPHLYIYVASNGNIFLLLHYYNTKYNLRYSAAATKPYNKSSSRGDKHALLRQGRGWDAVNLQQI